MVDCPTTAVSFLRAALFTQVLKASVALSILEHCPLGFNVEDFVNQLQKAHAFYKINRDKYFFHSNQLKVFLPLEFEGISHSINIHGKQNDSDCLKDLLSRLGAGVTSIRIGFSGLLDVNATIAENFVLPGVSFTFQSLLWVATHNEELERVNLLHQVSLLDEEANNVLELAGKISATLDAGEQSTTEITHFMEPVLDRICIVKQEDIYFGWLHPIKNFLTSYVKSIQETEGFGVPHLANSLCKHLLNRCCDVLRGTLRDSVINESLARFYSLLCPLLGAHQRKAQVGTDLIETFQRSSDVIESVYFKNGELEIGNGSIGLLSVLRNKLQCLVSLPS